MADLVSKGERRAPSILAYALCLAVASDLSINNSAEILVRRIASFRTGHSLWSLSPATHQT